MKVISNLLSTIGLLAVVSGLNGCGDDASFSAPTIKKKTGLPLPVPMDDEEPEVDEPQDADAVEVTVTEPGDPEIVVTDGEVIDIEEPVVVEPPPPEEPKKPVEASRLFWYWPCANEAAPAPSAADADVLVGAGHYKVDASRSEIDVEIAGMMCDASEVPRDVVFVIDVSDSMRGFLNFGNDPLRSGSCGRHDAVRAVVDTLGTDDQVAFVTFDGNVQRHSSGFLTVDAFKSNYLNADVFCEIGANTNFQKGLAKAEEFIDTARPTSSRELYFISDGEPTSNSTGAAEAARIRQKATIATMMLKGDDEILINDIASKDANGDPLHAKVGDASQLASGLANLAKSELVFGAFYFGPLNDANQWQSVSIDPKVEKLFRLPETTFAKSMFPDGVGFSFVYGDSRGLQRRYSATLTFD